jgi:AraC-like DNA-binding protein
MENNEDITTSEEGPVLPSEKPEQDTKTYPTWEYPERRDPKWGTVTKKGLIVGRGATQRVVPPDDCFRLASMGCTDREIADWFEISESTLRYNFSSYLTKARSQLKQRLRLAQLRVALDGNPTMLIWLGKQILGQTDNPYNNEDQQPLPWAD